MESTEQKNHTCPTSHCCDCAGCGSMHMHTGMKRYWTRHFIVLILGVILAFCVGMKLGEIKGFMMANYGGMPMHGGWMTDSDYRGNHFDALQTAPVAPQPLTQ